MGWIALIAGVVLWAGAHFFKRLAPEARARMGDGGKGLVAGLLVLSIVLMWWGYRNAYGPVWWGRTPMLAGINNILMLLAFYLFAASGAKTAVTRRIRHPQLTAFKTFTIAHMIVNGDLASWVLFGGLLAWAVAEVIVINRAEPEWTPAHPVPVRKEITAAIAALVVFAVVAAIHAWFGYNPFG